MTLKNRMGKVEIRQEIEAYSKEAVYDFDNSIMLKWYPLRIAEKVGMSDFKSLKCLELGVSHGYSTSIFEKYFSDYTVLDADSRVIEKY